MAGAFFDDVRGDSSIGEPGGTGASQAVARVVAFVSSTLHNICNYFSDHLFANHLVPIPYSRSGFFKTLQIKVPLLVLGGGTVRGTYQRV